ncbi:uncharacterized protein [Ptychodera flava]|uniref:uncharacterized protein n=1 Tax=Ptychodera flava TaxID=63121 RepID=UPI003969BF0B
MVDVKTEQALRDIYYNPETGFGGAESLYRRVREQYPDLKVTRRKVKEWLDAQLTYTLHRPVRRTQRGRRIFVTRIDEQWQMDLVEMGQFERENGGMRYLLTVIDVLSKYAWAVPIKTKTGDHVLAAMKGIINDGEDPQTRINSGPDQFGSNRRPDKLQSDEGREFTNKKMQDWLAEEEEIFVVRYIVYSKPPVYRIEDLSGEEILGTFYEDELQAVNDSGVYRIEKILKTKKVKGQKYYLIKWRGYPDSFNSWEPESNVVKSE